MDNFALKQLGQIVYQHCGLNYLNNLESLLTKLSKRMKELNLSSWEYMRLLQTNKSEWDIVIELLTINETYFYREDTQLKEFKDIVLPELIARKRGKPIRIWSAACSSGEEPYTLAMLIHESKLLKSPGDVRIIATDINKKVLEKAKRANYSKQSMSFRRIPKHLLTRYFTEQADSYTISPSIQSMVTFENLNLIDSNQMARMTNFDVIFCRNVLIYFDQATIKKTAERFYQSLNSQGVLFLGHSENISTMNTGFKTVSQNSTFYYRKG